MWIIEFLQNENIIKLKESLENMSVDYKLVENKNGEYMFLDKELLISTGHILNESFLKEIKGTFLYGSKLFIEKFNKYSFDSAFLNYENYFDLLKIDMLNDDIVIGTLRDLDVSHDKFFIRPIENNKVINGKVITKEEFITLKDNFYLTEPSLYDNELFLVSPIKEIEEEYRFFILNKKIVGSSSYKPNKDLMVSDDLINYVKQKINEIPIETYVIDIAIIENNQFKIIEFNNFNTSGIYNIDLDAFVKEVNNYLIR